jgi:hypothetical protein
MVRGSSIVLGAGLVILWLVGLARDATPWLTWFNLLGGLFSFAVAAAITPGRSGYAVPAGAPMALAVFLSVLFIVAMSIGASSWMAWWTFAFACAYMILGLLAIGERTPTSPTLTHPRTL